jgi:mono/diheme cytochrome c family protein
VEFLQRLLVIVVHYEKEIAMRFRYRAGLALVAIFTFILCGGGMASDGAKPSTSPASNASIDKKDEYYKPLSILTRNCAGCHQAADHPGALFLNKARLSEPQTIDLMINLIETSQMPPAHVKFKKTEDGKTLLAWLKAEKAKHKQ